MALVEVVKESLNQPYLDNMENGDTVLGRQQKNKAIKACFSQGKENEESSLALKYTGI